MKYRYEILLVVLLSINFGIVFLDRNALNYMMPFVAEELHLDNSQIGMLAGATALSWALSGLFFSMFSDRTGKRKTVIVIVTVLFSIASIASGFATSFIALLLIRLLMGAAEGPVLPISQAMIAAEVRPERRGLFMGIMNNFGANLLGVMIAPPLLVGVAAALGWRTGFWLAGLPGLIMAALIYFLLREPPKNAALSQIPEEAKDKQSWGALLKSRNILLCSGISCCMLAWTLLGWVFLPVYLVREAGFTPGTMGILISVLGASALVSCVLVPALSDRIGRVPTMVMFTMMGILAPLAIGFSGLATVPLAIAMFIGWSASGTLPLFMATIPAESIPRRQLATAMALVMGVGEVVGGAIVPVVAGALATSHGLIVIILIQSGAAAIAAFLSLFLKETAPRKVKSDATLSAAI
ncbi:MFS transporter [Brevundimonas sp.]|uniref:MFS transporter n=1 Tax=Brevundimonas sp. TaxID=1871086 RepID=UPI003D0EB2F8